MPLLQKIEVSNFLNSTRAKPWRPDWPHQVLDIGGVDAALNIPNGKGKSTMITAVLAMLTGHSKSLKDIRNRFFAPPASKHYTHIRIEVRVPMPGEGEDMFAREGGEPGGQPMVFGMYGYSGENEDVQFYAYHGTFQDSPVAHVHDMHHTLIADDAFLGQLKSCQDVFPSTAKERTKRAWLQYVEDYFDMSSLKQQLVYQLLRGAEGGSNYFDVKTPVGMSYSAGVFYERLAPALLTDLMGELGEEGEHGIEDTIHLKVTKVIAAKRETARKKEELHRAENTLQELESLVLASDTMKEAQKVYNQHRDEFALELAVLKNVVVDDPIPGVPRTPPDSLPGFARAMVLQGGQWFLPDRVIAEFTGETTSAVNQRAVDRNHLQLQHASKSQLLDFACDQKNRDPRGRTSQLYSRDSALALLGLTSNFTRDWTREKAIAAVTQAFDWVETHGDTNPARKLKKRLDTEIGAKTLAQEELSTKYKNYQAEREQLLEEQSQVGAQQAEYRRMAASGLFTDEELAEPAQTGQTVVGVLQTASRALDEHKARVLRLSGVYQDWQAYLQDHGESIPPKELIRQLQVDLDLAKERQTKITADLGVARGKRRGLSEAKNQAEKRLNNATAKLNRFLETLPALIKFRELFGDYTTPVGLAGQVRKALADAQRRIADIEKERERYKPSLEALSAFRKTHGDDAPETWIEARKTAWASLGKEIDRLADQLKEANLRREALDQAVIVPGKVSREAAEVAGGNQVPLHAALENMGLDPDRKERALTLFSALLHAPVYGTVDEAAEAAARLEEAGIEAPVFLRPDLEAFCRTGEINQDAISAHTWLVGIRTRQVDCLLDTALVEREKEDADNQIQALTKEIDRQTDAREKVDPEHAEVATARLAATALKNGYQDKDEQLADELQSLSEQLPELEAKASTDTLNIINQADRHLKEFADISEEAIKEEQAAAELEKARAEENFDINESSIEGLEFDANAQQELVGGAMAAANRIPHLQAIQDFMDHPDDNPAFMASAEGAEADLNNAVVVADKRTRFQFDLVETFVKKGPNRPKEIELRLKEIQGETLHIQNTLLPPLNEEIKRLGERLSKLGTDIDGIDHFVRELIRKYRDFAAAEKEEIIVPKERIEYHSLGGFAIGLREATNPETLIRLLLDIDDDIRGEDATELRMAMSDARNDYQTAKSSVASLVDKILVMPDLDISEHVRIQLEQAKENSAIAVHLRDVAKSNFEKNQAANKTAAEHLEVEWGRIGEWLKAFTQRLPTNLKLMKNTFGPLRDKESKALLTAGFEIEATVADQNDIKTVLEDVVKLVEKSEQTERAVEHAAPTLRNEAVRGIRAEIRNTFYQRVILNPSIQVYMPSISPHLLKLEKGMVSTGQGVAMTLLWIVKMADYITQREMNRMTTDRAQQKRLHPTQFALMDGAFSSLSNKGLIKDALDSIKSTRGRFQLIITGHDENYQNNFDYFPTLIEAREINGQFMYAEKKTRRIRQPEEVGSHYGAMGVMSMRVLPHAAGAAAGQQQGVHS